VSFNINDVLNRQQSNFAKNPTTTVPKKLIILVFPYLGYKGKLLVISQSAYHVKYLFPYKDRINHSQLSKIVYKVVETARISASENQNIDCMTEKLNFLK